jgi:hypothetical protein
MQAKTPGVNGPAASNVDPERGRPTWPTDDANPVDPGSVADTDRRRYSIVRTRPLDVR